VEQLVLGSSLRPGAENAEPTPAPVSTEPEIARPIAASGVFEDEQQYRAARVGDFHVRVSVRVADEVAALAPMVVLQSPSGQGSETGRPRPAPSAIDPLTTSRLATGVDDRGAYVDVDGQRFYFSIGYTPATTAEPPQLEPRRSFEAACAGSCQCQIESRDHAEEVGRQVRALDRSRPEWRRLDATARSCVAEEARSRCYSRLSFECKARCEGYFASSLTDRVSGYAVGADVGEARDAGDCAE
jgi:hypothetical protein